MLAPVGNDSPYDTKKPRRNADTASRAAVTETERYVFLSFMATAAGKMMRLEISREPRILMPTTIVRAVRSERRAV